MTPEGRFSWLFNETRSATRTLPVQLSKATGTIPLEPSLRPTPKTQDFRISSSIGAKLNTKDLELDESSLKAHD